MISSELMLAELQAAVRRDAAAHDQVVLIVAATAKAPEMRPKDLRRVRDTYHVTLIQARLWIRRLENAKSATMPVVPKTTPERTPAMPTVELPERSVDALIAIKSLGPCTARQVAVEVAGSEEDATDARGWAQTIRRLVSDHGYVERNDKGEYKLTSSGRSAVNRAIKARASESESDTEPVTD